MGKRRAYTGNNDRRGRNNHTERQYLNPHDAIEKNSCNKVTRTLVEGSLEVHEIKDFGAIAMGLHTFYNNQEPDAIAKPSKFIMIWRNNNNHWEIAEVISLH